MAFHDGELKFFRREIKIKNRETFSAIPYNFVDKQGKLLYNQRVTIVGKVWKSWAVRVIR